MCLIPDICQFPNGNGAALLHAKTEADTQLFPARFLPEDLQSNPCLTTIRRTYADPLSMQCKHVTVAGFLRRGRSPVCKHTLEALPTPVQGYLAACWEPLLLCHLGFSWESSLHPGPLPGAGSISQCLLQEG